jgi:hypothetical protein
MARVTGINCDRESCSHYELDEDNPNSWCRKDELGTCPYDEEVKE